MKDLDGGMKGTGLLLVRSNMLVCAGLFMVVVDDEKLALNVEEFVVHFDFDFMLPLPDSQAESSIPAKQLTLPVGQSHAEFSLRFQPFSTCPDPLLPISMHLHHKAFTLCAQPHHTVMIFLFASVRHVNRLQRMQARREDTLHFISEKFMSVLFLIVIGF